MNVVEFKVVATRQDDQVVVDIPYVVVVKLAGLDEIKHVEGPIASRADAEAYVHEMLEPGFLDLEGVVVPLFQIDMVPHGAYDVS